VVTGGVGIGGALYLGGAASLNGSVNIGIGSANYFAVAGAATGVAPQLQALGSDTNISINYVAKGTGSHIFAAGGGTQFTIGNIASSVNYLTAQGAATTANPSLNAVGSDTNINLSLVAKGTGTIQTSYGLYLAGPGGNPTQYFNASVSGSFGVTYFQMAGKSRWAIYGMDGSAESTGNVGSNFVVERFNDAGTGIDFPIGIRRSDGAMTLGTFLNTAYKGGQVAIGASSGAYGLWLQNITAAANNLLAVTVNTVGAGVGGITANDTTTAFNTSSDIRLKKDIHPFEKATDILQQLKVYNFKWTINNESAVGMVAQEVNEVFPQAVVPGDDRLDSPLPWMMDYSKLVPVLVAALQDANARIVRLESMITNGIS
jgi:hypothetical protein